MASLGQSELKRLTIDILLKSYLFYSFDCNSGIMQKMRMSWQLSCRVMYTFLDLITALHFIDVILQTFEYNLINPLWNTTQACFAVMTVVNEDMRLWSCRTKAWYLLHDIPGMKTMVRVGTDITQQQNRDEMAISLGKYYVWRCLNTTRPKHTGSHFAGDVFKCMFLTENVFVWMQF